MHLEDRPFTETVRNKSARGALAVSAIALLCGPDLTVRTAVTELGNLSTMGVLGSRGGGARRWHSTAKGKVGTVSERAAEEEPQSEQSGSPRPMALARDNDVPRSETNRKSTKFSSDLDKQKVLDHVNKNLT